MSENTIQTFIVQILMPNNSRFAFDLKPYLAKVISYKKGFDGLLLTLDLEKAHKYKTEKNARKPAQAYGGDVLLI